MSNSRMSCCCGSCMTHLTFGRSNVYLQQGPAAAAELLHGCRVTQSRWRGRTLSDAS